MNKEVNLGLIFMAAITVIVGVILLANVADTIAPMTTAFTHTNESVNIASVRVTDGKQINESKTVNVTMPKWVTDSVVLTYPNGTAFRLNTDYMVNYNTLNITIKNNTVMFNAANLTGANYQRYDTNYVDDSGSRAVIPLIILLFAISILVAIIVYFKQQSEDTF